MEARMGLPGPWSLLGHRVTQFQVAPALTHVAHTAPKVQPFLRFMHPDFCFILWKNAGAHIRFCRERHCRTVSPGRM